jgi:PAS domain S-box-containing protein
MLPDWDGPHRMSGVGNFDGYYLAVNAGYTRVLGWSPAEFMCAPYWEFVHPDDQYPMVESGDRLMRAGGVRTGYEVRLLCRDGRYRWTRWDTVADQDAELLYGVGVDIGDQKPASELDDERVVVGTWVRDVRARTLTWSDEMYGMFGIPPGSELTDDEVQARIHPQDRPLVEGAWRASLLAGEDAHWADFRVIHSAGTVRYLHSAGRVTASADGRPALVRGITLDVTDRPARPL